MISSNRHIRAVAHVAALLLLLAFVSVVANAYTIVFRDGRRIEIPDNFTVDGSTLTYEAGSGIQITLHLAAIDIGATERANGETNGSLIKHSAKTRTEPAEVKFVRRGATITNQDLERFRKARIASEVAYEKRRKELGLPSVEESRRAALSGAERAQMQLLSRRSEEQQSENYWRTRASELRADLSATNARINFVQSRLNELPLNTSFGGFTGFSPFVSIDQLSRGTLIPSPVFANPYAFPTARFGAGAVFGSSRTRGSMRFNPFARRGFPSPWYPNPYPFGTVVALPFDGYDNSYERTTLLNQLDELLARRAELQARWSELEDEARRYGAYPGWLR